MWSEHCSYKIEQSPLEAPAHTRQTRCASPERTPASWISATASSPLQNESHNHPSYVEPFQGATTGVGGILRDIFTMGARPSPSSIPCARRSRAGQNTTEEDAAKNRRILDGVVRGVGSYGNCFGVPTVAAKSLRAFYSAESAGSTRLRLASLRKKKYFSPKPRHWQSGDLRRRKNGPRRNSRRISACLRRVHGESKQKRPTCRSATPSWRNCCLKPASKHANRRQWSPIQDMGAAGLTARQ